MEDQLPKGGGAGGLAGDAEVADQVGEAAVMEGLAGSASGEEPAGIDVGSRVHVGALGFGSE
ncbi:hypothetical protein ACWEJ6_40375 [Nonomuraea sp. NPDC004702]